MLRGLSAEVVIPEKIGGRTVTAIARGAFYKLAEMTHIALPNTITSIGRHGFSGCRGLTEIQIPSGVVALSEGTFYGCEQLADVSLPPGLADIGEAAFALCHGLQTIDLPEATAVIGPRAFLGCSGLRSLSLPDGVRSIGTEAFAQCQALNPARASATSPSRAASLQWDQPSSQAAQTLRPFSSWAMPRPPMCWSGLWRAGAGSNPLPRTLRSTISPEAAGSPPRNGTVTPP